MLKNLSQKVIDSYFKHNQWLELTSLYEDDGRLTEQTVCLIEKGAKHCTFCIDIRTFSDMDSGWESQPYLIYDTPYNTFRITIPKFGYITPEDIKKAVRYIASEYYWIVFNIKLDGKEIENIIREYKISKEETWTTNYTQPTY